MLAFISKLAQNSAKAFAGLLLVTFFLGFAGITHQGMTMRDGMMMGDCPFMPGMSLCDMTVVAHLSAWQDAFTGIPQGGSVLLLVALAVVSIVLAQVFVRTLIVLESTAYLRLRRRDVYLEPPSLMQLLFSSGILHPKLHQ